MKNLIAIVLLLGSARAFAFPAVGDSVTYKITISKDTQSLVFTQKAELTAYDKVKGEFTAVTTLTDDKDVPKVTTEQVKEADVPNADYLTQITNFCEQLGGASKKITVSVGTFDACELPASADKKGVNDIAVIPFGLVKSDYVVTASGVHVVAELVAITLGK